ncbi:MAG TPA: nitroreductase family protein [Candidatus Paceibacterota bacterium]|nr:nitroreductase family protein [Candidatus Paceibacterota bacterium]
MELLDILKKRRSVRKYYDKKVSRDLIAELIKAAQLSPVSCNLQLTQYVVVDDDNLLAQLGRDVSYKFKYAPTTMVVLVDSRFTVERSSAVTTAGMAIENMILRAVELGLATCPMAGFGKDEVIRRVLGIPDHMDIVLLLAVGYQDMSVHQEPMVRMDYKEIYSFNAYEMKTLNGSGRLKDHTPLSLIDYRKRIAPVYLDRFRLTSFSGKYYDLVARELSKFKGDWLDLLSYDGEFVRRMKKCAASDYLPANLDFLKKELGCETVLIDSDNNILTDKKFDFISFVFQLDFTPDSGKLLKSAMGKLNEGGYIFIATIRGLWYKRLIFWFRRILRRLRGKRNNIYEGNVFYKIGPFSRVNLKLPVVKSFKFYKNGLEVKIMKLGKRDSLTIF